MTARGTGAPRTRTARAFGESGAAVVLVVLAERTFQGATAGTTDSPGPTCV